MRRIRGQVRSNVVRMTLTGALALVLPVIPGVAHAAIAPPNSVVSSSIKDGQVKTPDLVNGGVKNAKLATSAVTTTTIKDGAVGGADLGRNAITTTKIRDGGVTGADVANNKLTGADVNELTLAFAVLQRRIAESCSAGQAIRQINQDGTVTCEPVGGGSPTGPAGGDLTGTYPSPLIADSAVSIAKLGFDPATQAELDVLASAGTINDAGNPVDWSQLKNVPTDFADGTDADSGGTVTSVDAGTGLAGGPITSSGALSISSPFRLPQGCANGEVAKSDGSGSWSCASDQDSPGTDWHLGGNAGTTGADFLGTTDNVPLNLEVNDARALRLEPAFDGTNQSPNLIGGIADNSVTSGAYAATVAGGGRSAPSDAASANRVTDDYGTVGGGADNQAGDDAGTTSDRTYATVDGGRGNVAGGFGAAVGGGHDNRAGGFGAAVGGGGFNQAGDGNYPTVGGGRGNVAGDSYSTVSGGQDNQATGSEATVGGGRSNVASGVDATVPGGVSSTAAGDYGFAAGVGAQANDQGAFVWGDSTDDFVSSTANDQFTARASGGVRLFSSPDTTGATAPGVQLYASTSALGTLGTGNPFDIRVNNGTASDRGLRIEPASDGTNQSPNVIGGIADNSVTNGVYAATIAGGGRRTPGNAATANKVTGSYGTVGGGGQNQAGTKATVSGGEINSATGTYSSVSGGSDNSASGILSKIGGGDDNSASGSGGTVGGGGFNNVSGQYATVPGGESNTAVGTHSFAAGYHAWANHAGSFVWGDNQGTEITSTGVNQFIARASGHFFLQSDSTLDDQGGFLNTSTGAYLSTGGTWTNSSDENRKSRVRQVSARSVLRRVKQLPVNSWEYDAEPGIGHIGPMAQDFYRAFGLGADNKHIASVDADGVSLAATKGLAQVVERQRQRLRGQSRRIAVLERAVRHLRGGKR